jgi:hypothetical protein
MAKRARLGKQHARVDEGGGTCKRFNPAWLDNRHHQRRRRGAGDTFPLGSMAGASTKGRGMLILTLVAKGRSAGVDEERWRGSSEERKTKTTAARRRGSSGSSGGRCA